MMSLIEGFGAKASTFRCIEMSFIPSHMFFVLGCFFPPLNQLEADF